MGPSVMGQEARWTGGACTHRRRHTQTHTQTHTHTHTHAPPGARVQQAKVQSGGLGTEEAARWAMLAWGSTSRMECRLV